MNLNFNRKISIIFVTLIFLGAFALVAEATHSWGSYHWARTSNPFTLKVGDNVSGAWDSYLATAANDWSQSSVLDATVIAGQSNRNCRPTAGRIEVCNRTYGNNGWLGLAQIWVSGSHITQGVTKLNDTYFKTLTYNTPGWRSLVMCQEIGHNLGLDHQDENFNNAPIEPHTCMDYFVPGANEVVRPNQHDFNMLEAIYEHLDGSNTVGLTNPSNGNHLGVDDTDDPSEWGKSLRKDSHGNDSLFMRELGNGKKVFTFVIWAH